MNKDISQSELQRIQDEYTRRDSDNNLSELYSYMNPAFAYHMQEREWAILNMLRYNNIDISQLNMLEIGCGTGHILNRFLEFGATKAFGIDLMENRIKEGRKKYPNINFVKGNATQLPFPDKSFNTVMQFMCISSILDSEMRQQIANEMWRVLQPNGIIISYDMRPPSPVLIAFYNIAKLFILSQFRNKFRCSIKHITPTKPLSIKEIVSLFPCGKLNYSSVSLEFNMTRIARRSCIIASFLSLIPWFRTHLLVLIKKGANP